MFTSCDIKRRALVGSQSPLKILGLRQIKWHQHVRMAQQNPSHKVRSETFVLRSPKQRKREGSSAIAVYGVVTYVFW